MCRAKHTQKHFNMLTHREQLCFFCAGLTVCQYCRLRSSSLQQPRKLGLPEVD
jgi:hypothetical protein